MSYVLNTIPSTWHKVMNKIDHFTAKYSSISSKGISRKSIVFKEDRQEEQVTSHSSLYSLKMKKSGTHLKDPRNSWYRQVWEILMKKLGCYRYLVTSTSE